MPLPEFDDNDALEGYVTEERAEEMFALGAQAAREMLAAFDELLAMPDPIGVLYGQTVYLHHDTRELSFGDTRVDVDHVYLVGTAVRDEALRRLGEKRD